MNDSFVKTLVYRSWVESTNDLAKTILESRDETLPMVVWTKHQTRGRGRGTHVWWSDSGSLTFTIALDPVAQGLERRHEPRVALAAAVAVIDALASWQPKVPLGIRWPNDIEVGGRKIGGLLPERLETSRGPRIIVGIGLNVLSHLDDSPQAIRRMATSVAELSKCPQTPSSPEALLEPILASFASALDRLSQDDPALAARWQELDTLKNQRIRVDLGPRIVQGQVQGIDEEGALLLDTGSEPLRLFGGQVLRDDLGN